MISRKIKVGDTVEIQIGKLFKGTLCSVTMVITIQGGGSRYQVETSKGLVGYFRYNEIKKAMPCDLCDKFYTGKGYPVVDENYRLQKGLKSCGCNMDTPDAPQQHP